jgi:hypothetical protein
MGTAFPSRDFPLITEAPQANKIQGVMLVSGLVGIAYFFIVLFQCRDPSDYYNINKPDRQCMPPKVLTIVVTVAISVNAWADWCFAILPAFVVWELKIPLRQKIQVVGLMSFATL